MIGSSWQKVAKWLIAILLTVLDYYSIKNSFDFSSFLKVYSLTDKFMSSCDDCCLFTYVPLLQTIDIWTDLLYRSSFVAHPTPQIPENIFIEWIKFAAMSVEFSFGNIMYRQIDRFSIGTCFGFYFRVVSWKEISVLSK